MRIISYLMLPAFEVINIKKIPEGCSGIYNNAENQYHERSRRIKLLPYQG
jgi:hypothetical protein